MAYDDVAFIDVGCDSPSNTTPWLYSKLLQTIQSTATQSVSTDLPWPFVLLLEIWHSYPQNYLSYDPLPKASSQASTDAHLGPPTDYPAPGSSPVPPGSPDMGVGGRVFDFTLLTASPKGKSCLLSWGTCGDCGVNDLSSEEVS